MLDSIREGLRWNIAYMKEMISGDGLRFNEKGEFVECAYLQDLKSNALRDYYINSRNLVTHYHLWYPTTALDENGVTRNDYSCWGMTDIGIQYFPIFVAQYALGNFELFLDTGESNFRQAFFAQADWLMKNVRNTPDDTAVWEVYFNFTSNNVNIPWVSAMTQGLAISTLLRARQLTGDMEYSNVAERALRAFHFSIDQGGVTWADDEGCSFYEEYPSQPPCHVLNGHISAMFGLYDYYRVTNSQDALSLFNAGVDTLKRYLPHFDTGYWSKYDLLRKPGYAPFRYHRIHVELLKVLYEITGEEIFHHYIQRWSSYLNSARRANFAIHVAGHRMREYIGNRLRRQR